MVSSINAQIWLGHFDVWDKEGLIIYRNSSILIEIGLNLENVETLLIDAINSIDLYFPAFQYILWAGKTSEEAFSTVLFETRGEAKNLWMNELKILLIGCGKMGSSLLEGIVKS